MGDRGFLFVLVLWAGWDTGHGIGGGSQAIPVTPPTDGLAGSYFTKRDMLCYAVSYADATRWLGSQASQGIVPIAEIAKAGYDVAADMVSLTSTSEGVGNTHFFSSSP
jgi:hypothetical protein